MYFNNAEMTQLADIFGHHLLIIQIRYVSIVT